MAWGDVLGAIGAAAGGVNQTLQLERERASKERMNQLTNEIRQMIADTTAQSRRDVADINADAKRNHDQTILLAQDLKNAGNLAVAKDNNERARQVTQMVTDRIISEGEANRLNRLTLAEYNNIAAQQRTETLVEGRQNVANTQAGARVQAANIAAQGGRDVAQITQGGQNYRFNEMMPLRQYMAEQRRYPRGSAAAAAVRAAGGDVSQPAFGPTYQDYLRTRNQPPQATPSSAPAFSPSRTWGTAATPAQPALPPTPELPGMDLPPTPPPPAPPALPAPPPMQPPGMLPADQVYGGMPTPRGTTSALSESRLEEQANSLMSRIEALNKQGEFKAARALRDQLAALLKQ